MTCLLQAPLFSASTSSGSRRCSARIATLAVHDRNLRGDDGQGSDGAARQGAQRAPRAAQGRHRRLDQQAQEARPTATRRRTGSARSWAASRCFRTTRSRRPRSKLMQAGIRTKDLAFFIIAARFMLPVILGLTAVRDDLPRRLFPRMVAGCAVTSRSPASWSAATRRPTSGSRTRSPSAATRFARAFPTRSTCWSSAPRPV